MSQKCFILRSNATQAVPVQIVVPGDATMAALISTCASPHEQQRPPPSQRCRRSRTHARTHSPRHNTCVPHNACNADEVKKGVALALGRPAAAQQLAVQELWRVLPSGLTVLVPVQDTAPLQGALQCGS